MNTALLTLSDVGLTIPTLDRPILSNINYQVYSGDFVIILGSNGSGKSSLLKLLDKRYTITHGKILFNGKSLKHYPDRIFSREIKTLTQNYQESLFPNLTVLENYLLIKQQYEALSFSLNHSIEQKFFSEYISSFNVKLPHKLHQVVDRLSGGEKQALALALTVLYPPKVLLLDEHTSALDPKTAETIMALTKSIVEKNHITCLLTTHDLSEAKHLGNRILALKNGYIHQAIEASEKANITQAELLAACY